MKIFDLSQPVFGCRVYPGDPAPQRTLLTSIPNGDPCNLTAFSMCAHNGTHVDAPSHFIHGATPVGNLPLSTFVGWAFVAQHRGGIVTATDAAQILQRAAHSNPQAAARILLKGNVQVSLQAAKVFASSGMLLLGNEPQTVGPPAEPSAVHLALLSANVALLEGICLDAVTEGTYFLSAAPLNLGDADGAPCRAILIAD